MKDKRTKEQIEANNIFIKELAKEGYVRCNTRLTIFPPGSDSPKNERSWTLVISDNVEGVVIGWYKTRETARKQAKLLRKALRIGRVK